MFALAILFNYVISGSWPDIQLLGRVEYLGEIGVVLAILLWLFTFGFAEETGWRGFAVPTLQKKHSPLVTALVIGGVWSGSYGTCHPSSTSRS
jgi:membrane protease YdiL (CAAX protease family)